MENTTILKVIVGSNLYGTNTPTSDKDYSGLFIANEDYYFGLKKIDELDLSITDKDESGKNTEDAVDFKLYEIRNFTRLALQNNPNILEHIFVNKENIEYVHPLAQVLLDNAYLFPNKGAYDKFIGYAKSQKHKMIIKLDNYEQLLNAKDFFSKQEPNEYIVMFRDDEKIKSFFKEEGSHFIIGDLNFQKHLMVKKVLSSLTERLDKITNRHQLILKHGFDTKFGSNLLRLLFEGEELLNTGKLKFPLDNAEYLLDVKQGKYTLEYVLETAEAIEKRMKNAKENSNLPEKPRFDEVNTLIKSITKSYFEVMK